MTAIVIISSECDLRIEAHHRNRPCKTKLSLYKPLLSLSSHLKQLYISNKTECFSYRGKCGVHGVIISVTRILNWFVVVLGGIPVFLARYGIDVPPVLMYH